ncbi:hypothetical protein [Methylocaldum sp.]|jgi:hypothetical protein|uniref:hypothetical protein n=1 Tax=Methylocaldum sp. TaxID=1969727 RepID=UPI00322075BA
MTVAFKPQRSPFPETFPRNGADLYRTLVEFEYQPNLPADKLSEGDLAEQRRHRSHYAALIRELEETEWLLTSTGCINLPYLTSPHLGSPRLTAAHSGL